MTRRDSVIKFAVHQVADASGDNLASQIVERFDVSRSYANRILRELVADGSLDARGSTRARTYTLIEGVKESASFDLDGLDENVVWRTFVEPQLTDIAPGLRRNVISICQTGLTEMVNNAVDHSGGTTCYVSVAETAADIRLSVQDDGVGILKKLKDYFDLDDEKHAALELAKGKLTTDPERHTGEGIFFTSRMFDSFRIDSGGYWYAHKAGDREWIFEEAKTVEGTLIRMRIRRDSRRTAEEVYDRYAGPDDFSFNVTHVPVKLSIYGQENLVSRSQAKRLLARVAKFDRVMLDFDGVEVIGQAFADEVFRVFPNEHPDVALKPYRTSPRVARMIKRAMAPR